MKIVKPGYSIRSFNSNFLGGILQPMNHDPDPDQLNTKLALAQRTSHLYLARTTFCTRTWNSLTIEEEQVGSVMITMLLL